VSSLLPLLAAAALAVPAGAAAALESHQQLLRDIDDNRAHGRHERIGGSSLYDGEEYLYRLVKRLAGGGPPGGPGATLAAAANPTNPTGPTSSGSADMNDQTSRALPPCPDKPNCVSSQAPAADTQHAIGPLRFNGDANAAWERLRRALAAMPRTRIVEDTGDYLHAEATSLIFRFVDDLECSLDRSNGVIHIRSASRVGHGDLGVNRKRVENLRILMAGR
jgi:uncharacterized protein (DUF1499 family)